MTAVTGFGGGPVPLSISTACGGPLSLSTADAAAAAAAASRVSGTKHRRLTALLNFYYAYNERHQNRWGVTGGCWLGGWVGVSFTPRKLNNSVCRRRRNNVRTYFPRFSDFKKNDDLESVMPNPLRLTTFNRNW
jgi:hypothetical protein